MVKTGRPRPPVTDEVLVALARRGYSAGEIKEITSVALGVVQRAIRGVSPSLRIVHRLGHAPHERTLRVVGDMMRGMNDADCAESHGVTPQAINLIRIAARNAGLI